jgi:hypothetical protein
MIAYGIVFFHGSHETPEIFIHEVDNIYTNVVDPSYCSYNNVVTSCIFCESMVVGFTTIYAISAYHH